MLNLLFLYVHSGCHGRVHYLPTPTPLFACVDFQVRDSKSAQPLPPITPTQSFPPPPMLGGPPPPPGPMYPPPPPGVSSSTHLKRDYNYYYYNVGNLRQYYLVKTRSWCQWLSIKCSISIHKGWMTVSKGQAVLILAAFQLVINFLCS